MKLLIVFLMVVLVLHALPTPELNRAPEMNIKDCLKALKDSNDARKAFDKCRHEKKDCKKLGEEADKAVKEWKKCVHKTAQELMNQTAQELGSTKTVKFY